MKKILSLLSVLIISGTAVPTTIAASPYQKEENKLENSEMNYSQTNNLKRDKRQSKRILEINEKIIINEDEKEEYKSSMERIISSLVSNNIFTSIFESSENENSAIYELNRNINYEYFTIPVSIIQRNNTIIIILVFRIRDLYLQGFINNIGDISSVDDRRTNWHYYHFTREVDDDLTSYPEILHSNDSVRNRTHDLGYIGHYNNLMGERNQSIYWQNIASSFFEISNMGTRFESQRPVVQAALGRIVLITSEALRFRSIYNLIINSVINNYSNGPIYWNPDENSGQVNIRSIVTNWQSISNNIIDAINNIQARFGNNSTSISEWFYSLLSQLPTNTIAQALSNIDIRVILGLLLQPTLNCDRRRARMINNNDIKNEYCDAIKGQNQNYPLKNKKITAVKILDENTKGNNLSKLDMYIGTNEGFYLKKYNSKLFIKAIDINDKAIINITVYKNGNVYAVTNKKEIYFINTNFLLSDGILTAQQIFNVESSNIEKEIIMYYKDDKSDLVLENENIVNNNRIVKTFNLGKINPLNYKKIEILGNESFLTKNVWGDEDYWDGKNIYWGEKTINSINNTDIEKIIRNYKFSKSNIADIGNDNWSFGNNIILDKLKTEWWGDAWFNHSQSVGFTFYWENGNYYLQFLSRQYADSRGSSSNLKQTLKVGNIIRLYNN